MCDTTFGMRSRPSYIRVNGVTEPRGNPFARQADVLRFLAAIGREKGYTAVERRIAWMKKRHEMVKLRRKYPSVEWKD